MQYQKPPLTYQAQAGQLIQRGLIADAATLTDCLKSVNYYRLSGYWHPLRTRDAQGNLLDRFNPGASLAVVLDRYNFDRQLRLLLLEAIEPIEVWIRTALAYEHAHRHGPFAYTQATHLPRFQLSEHQEWLDKTRRECSQSKEDFILHFKNRYGSHHQDLPIWMAVELFSMGASRKFFAGCENSIRQNCAAQVGLSDRVLDSWLRTLTATRNFCAHHGRLWNRPLTFAPLIPHAKSRPDWHHQVSVPGTHIYAALCVCSDLLAKIAPSSLWRIRTVAILSSLPPTIPLAEMGFPPNWQQHPLWT